MPVVTKMPKNQTRTCVRPPAAAVSVVAMGGCRDEEEDDDSSCACVSAISVAGLYGGTCTSLRAPISDGPA